MAWWLVGSFELELELAGAEAAEVGELRRAVLHHISLGLALEYS